MCRKSGFTLIELMIVVTIIGILASIGIPTFINYLYRAKLAEAYIGVSELNQAQIVHYNDTGFFAGLSLQGVPGCDCTPPYGKKSPLHISDDSNLTWKKLGSPIANQSLHYFSYDSVGYYFDATETTHYLQYNENGTFSIQEASYEYSDAEIKTKVADPSGEAVGVCTLGSLGDVGPPTAPNRNIAVTVAQGKFKASTATCTFIIQFLSTNGSQISQSPLITITE